MRSTLTGTKGCIVMADLSGAAKLLETDMRLPTLACLIPAVALATPAAAHPGHLAGLAGHDHWVAGAAIGAAVIIGLWGALKGKRKDEEPQAEAEDGDAEEQAA